MEDFSGALTIAGAAPFIAYLVGLIKNFMPELAGTKGARINLALVFVLSAIWVGTLWQSDLVTFENLAAAILGVIGVAAGASGLRSWMQHEVLGSAARSLTGVAKKE